MPHAFLLHLSPSKRLPKHPYLNKYAQGLFYTLLEHIDPDLSQEVHALKRNPFTLWAKEYRKDSSVLLRITILDDTLFHPLLSTVLQESLTGLALGQDTYKVTRVLATPEGHKDADFCSWGDILCTDPVNRLSLRFLSPTVFSTSKLGGSKPHYTPLPDPRLILQSLFRTFQLYSPTPYYEQEIASLQNEFEHQFIVTRHDIKTELHRAGKSTLTGFVGRTSLRYQGSSTTVKKVLGQLGLLAFYSGLGSKTSYGMGQVRLIPAKTKA